MWMCSCVCVYGFNGRSFCRVNKWTKYNQNILLCCKTTRNYIFLLLVFLLYDCVHNQIALCSYLVSATAAIAADVVVVFILFFYYTFPTTLKSDVCVFNKIKN